MSDIEREEFEQAVTDRWSDSYSFTRFGDEDYYDEVLEGMWWGWQASRQAVSVPDAWCVVTNDDQIQYTSMVDKNLGLPIEQSHDYAWQQCNEVIQEWIELGLDAASKYVIRPIALLATPTKADDWIKCSDRLPAEYDGDLEGLVWVNDRDMTLPKYAQSRVHWSCVRGIAGYTHWMPTGFRRPQPPKQEGE
jgi:hypothetical protein